MQAEQVDCYETDISLQFSKVIWYKNENTEEWIKRLRIAAKECNYQEIDR